MARPLHPLRSVLLLSTCLLAVSAGRHASKSAPAPKKATPAHGKSAMGAAPAPATKAESSQDAPGPIVDALAAGNEWWKGMSIVEARKKLAEMRVAGEDLTSSGVTSLDQLVPLSDDGLYEIFTKGVPDVPGRLKGDEDQFLMCSGDAFINTFTNESWPRGPWPQGDNQPQNALNKRIWKGKVIYTNPKTNVTQLWNVMWQNSTVEATGVIYPVDKGLSPDGKPSVIVDYSNTEAIWDLALRDEARRVGPSMWLGVAWVVDPVTYQNPRYAGPFQPIVDTFKPLENATYKGVLQGVGVQGPNSSPTTSGITMPEPGQPLRLTYFAIDCQPNATPKLSYTSTSQVFHLLSMAGGFMPLGAPMPELNEKAGDNAVDDPSKGFPHGSDGKDTPIVLWPFKLSELGPIGYIKVPAFPFEPIFGEFWRYDFIKELQSLGFDVSQLRTADMAPALAPAEEVAGEEAAELSAEAPSSEA